MENNVLNKQIIDFIVSFTNKRTQSLYSKTLNDFVEYLSLYNVNSITTNTLIDYQTYLRKSGYSPRSYVVKTQIVRRFFKVYYPEFSNIDDVAFHQDKVRDIASKYIQNSSFYASLKHAQEVYGFQLEKLFRFFVVSRIFIETGVRVEEVISIRCDDLDSSKKTIIIRSKKERSLYISDVLSLEIDAYLRMKYYQSQYLISNLRDGGQITTRQIERIIEEIEDKYTPRDLRHTFMCNERFLGKTFPEIADMVGGLPLHTINYLSDKVQKLIRDGKVNIYKPKAVDNLWILHIINTIIRLSKSQNKIVRVNDFETFTKEKNSILNRLLRFVFRFPVTKMEKKSSCYFVDDLELVNSLVKYYSLKGKHESPKAKNKLIFLYDEWLKNGRKPRLEGELNGSVKELPALKFNEDIILWQKGNIQRRLRRKRYEYTLYDVDYMRKKAWFIVRTEETRSILFASNNFPCLFFGEDIPKATSTQAEENQLIKQRIFYDNIKKYNSIPIIQ